MNGFDLSTISSVYVGSTLYSSIYYESTLIWPILSLLTTGLPSGYKYVEYIIGDTNWSFIDTGVLYNANLKVDCVLQDNLWALYGAFFGAYESESSPSFRLIYTNLQVALGYYTAGSIAGQSMLIGVGNIGSKRRIILDKDGVDVNGTYTANIRTITSASLNKNILIGRISIPSSKPASASTRTIKIYTFKIWNSGILVFEGIPCIRISDNTVGLYDTVSKRLLQPYYPEGSFTAGPYILPPEYTKLEYISSTNNGNQYIDVGMRLYEVLNTLYDIAIKFSISSTNAESQATMFNCLDPNNNPWLGTFIRRSSSNVVGRYIGGSAKDNTLGQLGNVIELPVLTSPNKNVTNINNNNSTHLYGVSLFSSFSDTNNTPQRCCNGTLYYFKLFVNGALVRDMIPCKNSNNVVGMYDIVNDVFYTSPNGAAFVAGPEV